MTDSGKNKIATSTQSDIETLRNLLSTHVPTNVNIQNPEFLKSLRHLLSSQEVKTQIDRLADDLDIQSQTSSQALDSIFDMLLRGDEVSPRSVPLLSRECRIHLAPTSHDMEGHESFEIKLLADLSSEGRINCDRHVIAYECADRCLPPKLLSSPDIASEEAYVYTDVHIFSGFPDSHYRQLKDLGIRRVQILSYDGLTYEPITDGFVDLLSQKQRNTHSTEVDEATGLTLFLLLVVVVIAAVVTHRMR